MGPSWRNKRKEKRRWNRRNGRHTRREYNRKLKQKGRRDEGGEARMCRDEEKGRK